QLLHGAAVDPYTTLFRSLEEANDLVFRINHSESRFVVVSGFQVAKIRAIKDKTPALESVIVFDEFEGIEERELSWAELLTKGVRSEEHTSELQSRENLVC